MTYVNKLVLLKHIARPYKDTLSFVVTFIVLFPISYQVWPRVLTKNIYMEKGNLLVDSMSMRVIGED